MSWGTFLPNYSIKHVTSWGVCLLCRENSGWKSRDTVYTNNIYIVRSEKMGNSNSSLNSLNSQELNVWNIWTIIFYWELFKNSQELNGIIGQFYSVRSCLATVRHCKEYLENSFLLEVYLVSVLKLYVWNILKIYCTVYILNLYSVVWVYSATVRN